MDVDVSTIQPLTERYRFAVPLTKSYTTVERGERLHILEGVASDESIDRQGERLIQQGMDFQPLLETGILNWDHQPGPENIIGEPMHGEIQPGPCFFVRGLLYVKDKPRAREAWRLAKAMERSNRRRLAWSVEGDVLRRDRQQIVASEVRHLAVTHQPINGNSWASIAKSMTSQTPILLENLDDQVISMLWGDCCADRQCYTEHGYFHGGRGGMLEHLHKCKGMPIPNAVNFMKRLINSGI